MKARRQYHGCQVDGCSKPHSSRGYCGAHYRKFMRYGDALGGKMGTEHGVPLRFIEEVVRPWDRDDCLLWPYSTSDSGYAIVWLDGRMQRVTRILCEERDGPPPSPNHEAAHSCGKGGRGCVNLKHLRWASPSENQMDRAVHGTSNRGERHGLAKVSREQVLEIRKLAKTCSYREIATRFSLSPSTVGGIARGTSWSWLKDIAA